MVTVRDMNRIRRINVYIESAFWTFDLYNFRPFVSDLQACMLENDTVMNFIPIPTELKVDKVNIMLIKS